MLRLHRARRPLSLPRLLMLALLVLGMLSKPVLASIGEIHELQHDPSGHHLLEDGDDGHPRTADTGTAASPDGDGDGLVHELLHFAHCCGQSPQSVAATAMTVPMAAATADPPAPTTAAAPRHRGQDLFRPPIAA